ncbi:MAG: hypothetical protein HYR63_18165 [Proteobacteria bacterium]|nr:hypothetical protein [Pseudomonadota bacterium]MBI3496551.1 hypothetical protein [Pseudomonadota bacterium]
MTMADERNVQAFRESRRARNRALLLVLLGLCLLFYVLSIVRMSGG